MISDANLEMELKNLKLTKSQKQILTLLRKKGKDGITPKQLMEGVAFAPRTVRYALRNLLKKKLIRRIPCLLHETMDLPTCIGLTS